NTSLLDACDELVDPVDEEFSVLPAPNRLIAEVAVDGTAVRERLGIVDNETVLRPEDSRRDPGTAFDRDFALDLPPRPARRRGLGRYHLAVDHNLEPVGWNQRVHNRLDAQRDPGAARPDAKLLARELSRTRAHT